ncbi:MAG: S8 family peptidase [Casimicrobiaceae bacterium]
MNDRSEQLFLRAAHCALLCLAVLTFPIAALADTMIESITIKWRDDALAQGATAMPDGLQTSLSRALRMDATAYGRTRDGAFVLRLPAPLELDVARAAINRVRATLPVIYANLNAPTEAAGRISAKSDDTTPPQPPVTKLIIKYRDPTISNLSVQNVFLGEPQLAHLSALAGQPVAHERAMAGGAFLVRLFQSVSFAEASALAARIEGDPSIEYADPDGRAFPNLVPNDAEYSLQWHYQSPPAEMGGVNLPPAWNITTGSSNIYVAVIDTGILPHHDLAGRYQGGYDMISEPTTANDGDPVSCTIQDDTCSRDADPTDAGDWITSAESGGYFGGCQVTNSSWHGSHVSGTIGALTNNATGVAGVNWVSKVIPVRVLGKCGGSFADIIDGITWAYGGNVPGVPNNPTPVRVMNMSLGGTSTCIASLQSAITGANAAGAVVSVSAGNGNVNAVNSTPANCNGVITVAAVGRSGQRASYSNYGAVVEIAAPGGSDGQGVLSTLNSGSTTANPAGYNYVYYQGTSMASPHVAGIASLLLSINPALTPAQVLATIQTTARAFPTGTIRNCTTTGTFICGAGIIDAGAAALAVQAALPSALVYKPIEPCRIMDTRSATVGSGVQGPIAGNSLKTLPGFITAGQNWGQYGGSAASDCGLTNPPGSSIRAVALVATILNPNFDAYLGIGDTNSLSSVLSNVALNFTSGQGLSTQYMVPQIASSNIYFAMPAGLSGQVIFDVVGYHVIADATALQCTSQASAPVSIGGSSSGGATSPACSPGYTLTGGSCDSAPATLKITQDKASGGNAAWFCAATNSAVSAANLTATATCCRAPGK